MNTRLTVNLNAECAAFVRAKQAEGQTATETIRHSVSVYGYLEAMRSTGAHLIVEEPDGTRREVVFL